MFSPNLCACMGQLAHAPRIHDIVTISMVIMLRCLRSSSLTLSKSKLEPKMGPRAIVCEWMATLTKSSSSSNTRTILCEIASKQFHILSLRGTFLKATHSIQSLTMLHCCITLRGSVCLSLKGTAVSKHEIETQFTYYRFQSSTWTTST